MIGKAERYKPDEAASVKIGGRFANAINPMPKIVYSRTLQNPGWNTQVKRELIPEEIIEMKAQPFSEKLILPN